MKRRVQAQEKAARVALSNEIKDEMDELCRYFETLALPANKAELMEKLRNTVNVRKKCLKPESPLYTSSRHLYVVDPKLVCNIYLFLLHFNR